MLMIDPYTKLEQIFLGYPEAIRVFARHGLACLGCSLAAYDTLERGAKAHGIDVATLIRELDEASAEAWLGGDLRPMAATSSSSRER